MVFACLLGAHRGIQSSISISCRLHSSRFRDVGRRRLRLVYWISALRVASDVRLRRARRRLNVVKLFILFFFEAIRIS